MALLGAMIKTLMAVLLALATLAMPAEAATFSMKRGLNLDQWTTWTGEEKWNDPSAILSYPEWRKFLKADDLKTLIARAEAHGFSWSVWGYGGAFGIVDAFDGDKAEPNVMDAVRSLR
ncbi:hypothetical protein [Mesorhizobium sp. WSM4884]|uniref:hypothetical protein n=1 Tax=Mesorhizobium sp. WSM4884 TaxID=3038542 RepID=UPI002417B6D5|nr:hypothetical protein [Mesorhizobium sp. WSM4884]MDG4883619.1 hypothetical protein [Mesorhizobium sp. WSM4884]